MSIPMLLVFWGIALFNPTLPHWSGPAYIPLYFIVAAWLDQRKNVFFPGILKWTIGFVAVALLTGIVLIRYSPVHFGSQSKEAYGEYCPTLDLSGWASLGEQFSSIVKEDIADGQIQSNPLLLTNKWFPGGHLEFYVSSISGVPLIGVGTLQDLHQFAWLNQERPRLQIGMDAYAIVPSNLPLNVEEAYGAYFDKIEPAEKLKQQRGGGVVRYFYIYRLRNCKKVPAPLLP